MMIVRTSMLTGVVHGMNIDVTQDQLDILDAGELVQNVLGHLDADEREFIMTGITAQEWDDVFGGGNEGVA